MEDTLKKILSDLEYVKGHLKNISSIARSNAERIKRNRELLDRNYKTPAQNEKLIRENREFLKGNKKQIEQNGRLLKQILTRLERLEAKVGKGSPKRPSK
jgi:hypothetical protein